MLFTLVGCAIQIQHFISISRQSQRDRSKSLLVLHTVLLRSQLVGCSRFRLLRLLSRKHIQVQGLWTYSDWTCSLLCICQYARGWSRVRSNDDSLVVSRLRDFLWQSRNSRLQSIGRIWQILQRHSCLESHCKQCPQYLRRCLVLSDLGPLWTGHTKVDLGHNLDDHRARLWCGRPHQLFIIFQNFLALMGYWLVVMVCIVFEEHLIFKPRLGGLDWSVWEDSKKFPIGIAALVSFLLDWVGAILGMYQTWYTGPLAARIGDSGADVGMWIGSAFALVTFPPLR